MNFNLLPTDLINNSKLSRNNLIIQTMRISLK